VKRKVADTSHVVFHPAKQHVLWCERCDGQHELKLPMDIHLVAEKMKAFVKLHEDCEPRATNPTTD
jgi:hypothetical protein